MLDLSLLPTGASPPALSNSSELVSSSPGSPSPYHSRRPTILPYTTPLLRLTHTLLHLPTHLLSLRDLDSTRLTVPMFESLSFPRGRRDLIPSTIHLRLSHPTTTLQIYTSHVHFRARFEGLRWYVYNYRVAAFLLFTVIFYSAAVVSMAVAWVVVSTVFSGRAQDEAGGKHIKAEEEDSRRIKQEPSVKSIKQESTEPSPAFSISQLSDTATNFPGLGREPPPQFAGRPYADVNDQHIPQDHDHATPEDAADDEDEDEEEGQDRGRKRFEGDSGIGTSMESENVQASSVVRRRTSRPIAGSAGTSNPSRSRQGSAISDR